MGGLTEKIIPRNTPLPCVMEQSFTTNENGQTSIKITIVQGERETTSNNNLLGEFILSGLEPKPAGIQESSNFFVRYRRNIICKCCR